MAMFTTVRVRMQYLMDSIKHVLSKVHIAKVTTHQHTWHHEKKQSITCSKCLSITISIFAALPISSLLFSCFVLFRCVCLGWVGGWGGGGDLNNKPYWMRGDLNDKLHWKDILTWDEIALQKKRLKIDVFNYVSDNHKYQNNPKHNVSLRSHTFDGVYLVHNNPLHSVLTYFPSNISAYSIGTKQHSNVHSVFDYSKRMLQIKQQHTQSLNTIITLLHCKDSYMQMTPIFARNFRQPTFPDIHICDKRICTWVIVYKNHVYWGLNFDRKMVTGRLSIS